MPKITESDYFYRKNFEGEKVPTLEEYTKYCLDNNIRMFLDLKDDQLSLCETINNLFKEYPKLYDLAVVSSFNPFLIYRVMLQYLLIHNIVPHLIPLMFEKILI